MRSHFLMPFLPSFAYEVDTIYWSCSLNPLSYPALVSASSVPLDLLQYDLDERHRSFLHSSCIQFLVGEPSFLSSLPSQHSRHELYLKEGIYLNSPSRSNAVAKAPTKTGATAETGGSRKVFGESVRMEPTDTSSCEHPYLHA